MNQRTFWVRFQTLITIFWVLFDGAIAFATSKWILPVTIEYILSHPLPPWEWIQEIPRFISGPAGNALGCLIFLILVLSGAYSVPALNVQFRSHYFFLRNWHFAFSGGWGVDRPFSRSSGQARWILDVDDSTAEKMIEIDGYMWNADYSQWIRDLWRVFITTNWAPHGHGYILRGENDADRIADSRLNAMAACRTLLWWQMNNGIHPVNADFISEENGIRVIMTVERILPSEAMIEAINDRGQSLAKADGIRALQATGMSAEDAAATLDGKLQRKTGHVIHEIMGNPPENVQLEINTGRE